MLSFLETLVTLVAVVLVLALAAQSLQEVVKVVFPVKAFTRQQVLRGLLIEAGATKQLDERDGEALFRLVLEHLRGLGQKGVRGSAVRLDSLDAASLELILPKLDWHRIPGLQSDDEEKAQNTLKEIAKTAKTWFAMAMAPVEERNKRRMRGISFCASALLVVGLNADGFSLLHRARTDAAFRASVQSAATELTQLLEKADASKDEAEAAGAALRSALGEETPLFEPSGERDWDDPQWWAGILLMVFLVSLGAPFWNDLLGSLVGVKERIQREAKAGKTEVAGPGKT